jgi:pyruvate-ferredoxin/flavodoxin oxidoreductase
LIINQCISITGYGKKGEEMVQLNYKAIDNGKSGLVEVPVKAEWSKLTVAKTRKVTGDDYFDNHVDPINALDGYEVPVSEFMKYGLLDGSFRNNVAYQEHRQSATQAYARRV